jgi:hypothetical protein
MLDNAARLTWRGLAEGLIDDSAAERLSTATEARRLVLKGQGRQNAAKPALARPRPCRSPDRARSIARRRQIAASGAVPGIIAASFTTGELAALTVIARECQRNGSAVAGGQPHHGSQCAQAGSGARLDNGSRTQASRLAIRQQYHPHCITGLACMAEAGGGCKKPKSPNTKNICPGESGESFLVRSWQESQPVVYSTDAAHQRRP